MNKNRSIFFVAFIVISQLALSDVYIPDSDYNKAKAYIGISGQDRIDSRVNSAYQSILKDEVENKPLDVSLPQVSKYVRIHGALKSNDDDFPTTPDAELALRAKVPIRFAKQFPEAAESMARYRQQARTRLSEATKNEIDRNPEATRMLRDDFENLDKFYRMLNYREHVEGNPNDSFLDKVGIAWNCGGAKNDIGNLASPIREELSNGRHISDDLKNELDELIFIAAAGTRNGAFLSRMFVSLSGSLKPIIDLSVNSISSGIAGSGFLAGFATSIYDQMYVLAAYDYSNIKVDEQPIAPSIVNQAATMEAIILTGLELHSFKAPSGMLGQSGDIVRQIIVSSLNTHGGKLILSEMGKKTLTVTNGIVKITYGESSTEEVQEIVLDTFREISEKYWDNHPNLRIRYLLLM